MARIKNPLIRELASQLVRGPSHLKWKQTLGAEKLFRLIDAGKEYPYDFVTDHIASFRDVDTRTQRPLIPGNELIHDLPLVIDQVSESGPLRQEESPVEQLFSVEDLARRFGVSAKTVNRWRKDGLIGRKVRFTDGKIRTAFLPDSVEHFVANRQERVQRGRQFTRLSDEERSRVLAMARRMAPRGTQSQVVERIARRIGRSDETVRYVIAQWDEDHPTRALFPDRRRAFTPDQYEEIFRRHQSGEPAKDLADALGCAPSTIYRAVNQMRFEELRNQRPEWIDNADFRKPDARKRILQTPIPERDAEKKERKTRAPDGALPYIKDLWGGELLSGKQERALFERYNFLKFLTAREIDRMAESRVVSGRLLDAAEGHMARAAAVRDRLIQANLRLVVSIAKKHHGYQTNLADLISDGNVVLMKAIEKFDFARGQKFSTYCTWAVMKHYARSIPESNYQRQRAARFEPEQWRIISNDERLVDFRKPRLEGVRAELEEGLATLPDRERQVLVDHYGLGEESRGLTLTEIGRVLGVTKERVRQIEAAALERLRKLLGGEVIEEFARTK